MTNQKYSVFLLEPINEALRLEAAAKAAGSLGIPEDKVAKLLSRPPGFITRASEYESAEKIVNILAESGCPVEVRPWGEPSEPSSSSPPLKSVEPEITLDEHNDAPSEQGYAENDDRQISSNEEDVSTEDISFSEEEEMSGEETSFSDEDIPEEEISFSEDEEDKSVTSTNWDMSSDESAHPTISSQVYSKRRFPISLKMLLAALLPLLLFAGVTLYMTYSSVNDLSVRLLSEVGDNIALTLANDFSNYLGEQEVDINSEEAIFYFTDKLNTIESGLHETVGVHYTDTEGVRINGNWEPAITQSANFDSFTSGFSELAKQTLNVSSFEQSEDERRVNLFERTKLIAGRVQDYSSNEQTGNFYVVASPLKDGLGTVQVVISEGNVITTALGVIRPILFVALATLLAAILIVTILAFALANNIRRLANAAEQIALGELEQSIKIAGNDETRDLAESFETMRKSLKAAIERLSRRDD